MPGQARPGHTTAHKDAPVSNTSKILLLISSCQMVARMGFFMQCFLIWVMMSVLSFQLLYERSIQYRTTCSASSNQTVSLWMDCFNPAVSKEVLSSPAILKYHAVVCPVCVLCPPPHSVEISGSHLAKQLGWCLVLLSIVPLKRERCTVEFWLLATPWKFFFWKILNKVNLLDK